MSLLDSVLKIVPGIIYNISDVLESLNILSYFTDVLSVYLQS